MNRVLLVEDDSTITEMLKEFLSKEGFICESADTQTQALVMFRQFDYDIVLLDVSLPDGNGFVACSAMKASKDVPIIFLTASGDEHSVVTGLELGADDYVSKPFRPRELVTRIRTVMRRKNRTQAVINIGSITVDTEHGVVSRGTQELYLSALEYRLLLVFISNRGQILSRGQLLEYIWDTAGDFVNDNTLTVYIKRLRDKIEDNPQEPKIIKTVRGSGYKVD